MSPRTRAQVYEDLKELRRRGELPDNPLEGLAGAEAVKQQSILVIGGDIPILPAVNSIRILDVRSLADRVFGDEKKAEAWLHRPNASLSGQKPIDLLKDELGAAVVRETLEQIDSGIFA
jgi:hypothetical protein